MSQHAHWTWLTDQPFFLHMLLVQEHPAHEWLLGTCCHLICTYWSIPSRGLTAPDVFVTQLLISMVLCKLTVVLEYSAD
jgi:hypothetical protein